MAVVSAHIIRGYCSAVHWHSVEYRCRKFSGHTLDLMSFMCGTILRCSLTLARILIVKISAEYMCHTYVSTSVIDLDI